MAHPARPASAGRLPERLVLEPRGPLSGRIRVPGSKSLTNRALLVAALATGESVLVDPLDSDDTRVMRDCLQALGARIDDSEPGAWRVRGTGGALQVPAEPLFVGNSGTTARFLTAAAAHAPGPVVLDGSPRMRQRPIQDLVDALAGLGARVSVLGRGGCPPVRIEGGGLAGGRTEIDASRSSQFVSAVLLAAPLARTDVELALREGVLVSRPYVDLTLDCMRRFGAGCGWDPRGAVLRVRGGTGYRAVRYAVEGDASAATYPMAAAAITGGRIRVEGVPGDSLQPDLRFAEVLERMGCTVVRGPDHLEVAGPPGPLRPVDADLNEFPDAALTLAVVAAFASGPSRIRNIANLRIKETDRLSALAAELRKLGARARALEDALEVVPGPLHGAEIETYDDHRMAMSFALAGLRIRGVVIRDPGCVSKTWPDYFEALGRLTP